MRRGGHNVHRLVKRIIHQPRLFLPEPAETAQVPDRGTFGKRLDALHDLATETPPFGEDELVCDDGELAEGDEEEFLEAGDGPCARVGRFGVGRVAEGGKVIAHETRELGM